METNTRYVLEMHQRRKEGQAEIQLTQWIELDKPPPVEQVTRYLKGVGKLLFREAGKLIGEGKNLRGALYLLVAFCSYPSFVAKRLLALRKPSNQEGLKS
jgi:hypothetical protein